MWADPSNYAWIHFSYYLIQYRPTRKLLKEIVGWKKNSSILWNFAVHLLCELCCIYIIKTQIDSYVFTLHLIIKKLTLLSRESFIHKIRDLFIEIQTTNNNSLRLKFTVASNLKIAHLYTLADSWELNLTFMMWIYFDDSYLMNYKSGLDSYSGGVHHVYSMRNVPSISISLLNDMRLIAGWLCSFTV